MMNQSTTETVNSTPRAVCVSGGTSGIGAAIVAACLTNGDRVYTFGRNPERVDRLRGHHAAAVEAGNLITLVGDLSDEEFRNRLVAEIDAGSGRLDCLVNNAAIILGNGGTLEESIADWRATLEVNLIGPFALTQVCAPLLRRGPTPVVINISSACAQHPFTDCTSTAYSVSKAALDMLTRRLALALGPEGIRVNGVSPGVVPTEMWGDAAHLIDVTVKNRHVLQHRPVQPEDVANAVLFLASPAARVVTGTILNVDAGYTLG